MKETGKQEPGKAKGRWILLPICCTILGFALLIMARQLPGFAESYAGTVYPVMVSVFARIFHLIPFSAAELLLYGIILFFGVSLFRKKARKHLASRLLILAGVLFFLYCANCGVNYYRTPFSEKEGFSVEPSSAEELRALCLYLHEKLMEAEQTGAVIDMGKTGQKETENIDAKQEEKGKGVQAEEENEGEKASWDTVRDMMEEARKTMQALAEQYPSLQGYYPRPKPLCVSWILSVQQVSGIYSPFTIEANVNRDMVPYNIPFTACHELSHLRGFMREDEANFIAFLACVYSDNPVFQRSGLMMGYLYAANALYAEDRELCKELSAALPDRIRNEYAANNAFWEKYDTAAAQVHEAVNDAYLKAHRQEDGVKSYGRVLDLMLVWHRNMQ
ncbi:MAG: DUF3810 domain-containing protein [Verrucomicrobia bacterium]|nr:DUF3810 domain-containing protein [Lachnospiraceae bacterium]MBR4248783.1 DUF3810 domain-containing protein [Verrucomicrobiota bacterium]